jgi:hypothetical protein
MKVPDKFPDGSKFFETDSGMLAVSIPDKGVFKLVDGELVPSKRWPPSSYPMTLSEASWRKLAADEAAAA